MTASTTRPRTRRADTLPPPSVPRAQGLGRMDRLIDHAEVIINALPWLSGVGDKLLALAAVVDDVVSTDGDAALASIHMGRDARIGVANAVHVASLCALTSRRIGMPEDRRRRVIAAALSSNASIHKLEGELHQQVDRPTPSQMTQFRQHTQASVELLRQTGVNDPLWLTIVAQHHERPDGTGYPDGLVRGEVVVEALMVGLAERYTACVAPRAHRPPLAARKGLRDVFKDPGYASYEPLVAAFIKELTVYPPGSFVRLNTDERAVVIRRGQDALCPELALVPADPSPAGPVESFQAYPSLITDSIPAERLRPEYVRLWDRS